MGRTPNDGRGRLGGRAKGTPNKPPQPLHGWAERCIHKNRKSLNDVIRGISLWNEAGISLYGSLIIAAAIDRLTRQLATLCPESIEGLDMDEHTEPIKPPTL